MYNYWWENRINEWEGPSIRIDPHWSTLRQIQIPTSQKPPTPQVGLDQASALLSSHFVWPSAHKCTHCGLRPRSCYHCLQTSKHHLGRGVYLPYVLYICMYDTIQRSSFLCFRWIATLPPWPVTMYARECQKKKKKGKANNAKLWRTFLLNYFMSALAIDFEGFYWLWVFLLLHPGLQVCSFLTWLALLWFVFAPTDCDIFELLGVVTNGARSAQWRLQVCRAYALSR